MWVFSKRLCCCVLGEGQFLHHFRTGLCIFYYYGSSSCLILYNKWLFVKYGFSYPLCVTVVHFFLCFLFAVTWVRVKDGDFSHINKSKSLKRTLVVGLMTGLDVSLSNLSYLTVSIPFMEMVKSSSPIWVLMLSFVARIESPTFVLIAAVALMTTGLALSVSGELHFNLQGFIMCLAAGFLAASRLVLSHTILHASEEDRLDTFGVLLIMAPASATAILPVALPLELGSILESKFVSDKSLMVSTILIIVGGGFLAINLNLSEFMMIGRTSALTLNVAGIVKVVAVSIASVVLFGAEISPLNMIGYLVCILGVLLYNCSKMRKDASDQIKVAVVEGDVLTRTAAEFHEIKDIEGGQGDQNSVLHHKPASPSFLRASAGGSLDRASSGGSLVRSDSFGRTTSAEKKSALTSIEAIKGRHESLMQSVKTAASNIKTDIKATASSIKEAAAQKNPGRSKQAYVQVSATEEKNQKTPGRSGLANVLRKAAETANVDAEGEKETSSLLS